MQLVDGLCRVESEQVPAHDRRLRDEIGVPQQWEGPNALAARWGTIRSVHFGMRYLGGRGPVREARSEVTPNSRKARTRTKAIRAANAGQSRHCDRGALRAARITDRSMNVGSVSSPRASLECGAVRYARVGSIGFACVER